MIFLKKIRDLHEAIASEKFSLSFASKDCYFNKFVLPFLESLYEWIEICYEAKNGVTMYHLKQIADQSEQIFRSLLIYLVDNQIRTLATEKIVHMRQKTKEMNLAFVAAVSPKGDYRKIMELANQKLLEEKMRKEQQSQNDTK